MLRTQQALRAKKGFTLVELIVVIAIIGVLAAILIPTLSTQITKSKITTADRGARSFYDDMHNWFTEDLLSGGEFPADGAITVCVAHGNVSLTNEPPKAPRHKETLKEAIQRDYAPKNFSAVIYIRGGKIYACTLQDNTTGVASDAPTDADFVAGSFSWGAEEGVTPSGAIVGTYPKLRGT